MKNYVSMLFGVVVSLAVGLTAGALQSDALRTWYPHLDKSALTPPGAVFAVVWIALYILMGISIGLIRKDEKTGRGAVTALFAAQLAANFLWSLLFFTLRSPAAALVDISVLIGLLALYIRRSMPLNAAGAWLFVPYLMWVTFAWYLNLYIVFHN